MLEKVYVCSIYLFMYFMILDESWEYLIDVKLCNNVKFCLFVKMCL